MVSFIELRSLEEGRRQDSPATCKVWAAFQLFSQAFKQAIGYKTLELIGDIRARDINLDSSYQMALNPWDEKKLPMER